MYDDSYSKLWNIANQLRVADYVIFVDLDTDERYCHSQSEFQITIPSVGTIIILEIRYSQEQYRVESVEWGVDDVTVRIAKV